MRRLHILILILILLSGLLLNACSSGARLNDIVSKNTASGGSSPTSPEYAAAMPEAEAWDDYDSYSYLSPAADIQYATAATMDSPGRAPQPSKIIRSAFMELRTDQFDEMVTLLRSAGQSYGGYTESSNLNSNHYGGRSRSRFFSITLRIPSESFDEALQYLEGLAQVTHSSQSSEDVSARYYDLAGRLETKRVEEERVLDMISRAEYIDDLLALEERLGQIRTVIEQYESQMISIDRLSTFSTFNVNLYEVTKEELVLISDTLGSRIQQSFVRSLNGVILFFQNAVIFFSGIIIQLIIIGIVVFAGVKASKFFIRRRNA